ncbi:MAG: universal stress protein [Acidobacteria bacterium]|nr:universal stress protein [Acidobacteriota bacterium]
MKLLEKILLATDFSKPADNALQSAIAVAKMFHSKIILMHVFPEGQLSTLARDRVISATSEELQRIQVEIKAQGVEAPQTILEYGSPFVHIIQQADFIDANVIMLGSGEGNRLSVTAEKVMRKAHKPVWVVKAGFAPPFKKILCPVDFSEPSRRAVINAIHMARHFEAELNFLHVIQPVPKLYRKFGLAASNEHEGLEAEEQSQLERFLQGFDFHNVNWTTTIAHGEPTQEILLFLRRLGCDLLIMGTAGQNQHLLNFMGSVVEKIGRELPCSIVTVKAEDMIQLCLELALANIASHYQQGKKLLENGFAEEAICRFRYCIEVDPLFAPAWECLAETHKRLGHQAEAQKHLASAKEIRKRLWEQQVESEIRSHHQLWRKKQST